MRLVPIIMPSEAAAVLRLLWDSGRDCVAQKKIDGGSVRQHALAIAYVFTTLQL